MRSTLLTLALTVLLAGAAATVAFLGGRATADAPGEYERGVRDGERAGRTALTAELRPGRPAYERLTRPARSRAYAAGERDGRARRATATTNVFAGFAGGWTAGDWYLINVAAGERDELKIAARTLLRAGEWYGLCDEPTGLCRRTRRP